MAEPPAGRSVRTAWCLNLSGKFAFLFMAEVTVGLLVAVLKTPTTAGIIRGTGIRPAGTGTNVVQAGTMTTLYASVSQHLAKSGGGGGQILVSGSAGNTLAPAAGEAKLKKKSKSSTVTKTTAVTTRSEIAATFPGLNIFNIVPQLSHFKL